MKVLVNRRVLALVLLVLVAVMGIVSIVRIMTKVSSNDGLDFHQLIWYPCHFFWQGDDPYAGALARKVPDLPIHYWDGVTVEEEYIFPFDKGLYPTNTAPLLLLASPIARLSWPTAVTVWKIINLCLLIVFAWVLVRLFNQSVMSYQGALVLFLLFSLIATREVIELGQTTVFNLTCMVLALLIVDERPIFAGVLMGFALSKYSLTFPGVFLLLYKQKFRSLVVAVLVQLLGILAISFIGGTPPWAVLSSYLYIMTLHVNWPGYQLTSGLLRGGGLWADLFIVAGSFALVFVIWRWHQSHPQILRTQHKVFELILLVILMQHNLLVVAHRRYDHVAEMLFLALIALWVYKPKHDAKEAFLLSMRQRCLVYSGAALIAMIWILPFYVVIGDFWYMRLYQVASITAVVLLAWLLYRIEAPVK